MTPAHQNAFRGIWPAMLTPLTESLDIDHDAFAAHALKLLDAGCGGVTAFGTTGEGPSFSMAERMAAVEALVARGVPASRLMVSTSCAAPSETVALTRHAVELGVHGCLVLPPFFFKGVSDQGIIDSFRQIMDRSMAPGLAVYLYHIPQVTGVPLSQHVIRSLFQAYPQHILGIKDSQCDQAHSLALAAAFMKDLTVYVGFEPDLPALGREGSTGAISGLANFVPRLVHRLVADPDGPGAARDLARVKEILAVFDGFSLMPALKTVMAERDDNAAWLTVRAPLVAVTPAEQTELRRRIQALALDPEID